MFVQVIKVIDLLLRLLVLLSEPLELECIVVVHALHVVRGALHAHFLEAAYLFFLDLGAAFLCLLAGNLILVFLLDVVLGDEALEQNRQEQVQ